jgi:hypothetical protein
MILQFLFFSLPPSVFLAQVSKHIEVHIQHNKENFLLEAMVVLCIRNDSYR